MLTEGHHQAVRVDTGIQHIKAKKEEENCYFCFLLITNFSMEIQETLQVNSGNA